MQTHFTSSHESLSTQFSRLCALEPRLRALFDRARSVRPVGPNTCAASQWYGYADKRERWHKGIIRELESLVGYFAQNRHPLLTTSLAYDTAVCVIWDALPFCDARCCIRDTPPELVEEDGRRYRELLERRDWNAIPRLTQEIVEREKQRKAGTGPYSTGSTSPMQTHALQETGQ
jgi:hypothetical protein